MLTIKTSEFSIGKLMVKNCMDAILNQPPLQCLPCFYSRGRVEYPAPWGGIRVFNPDCNTF